MNWTSPVIFAGAGPGATDLISVRALEAVKSADMIIYAGSLVNPEILKSARQDAEILDSAAMSLEEIITAMQRCVQTKGHILRLHTGDPSVYGAIGEQIKELDKLGISYEVIPGVSSVFGAAAALKTELTLPGVSQTIILTRRPGRTPVPEGQDIKSLASHKATMAIFLSVAEISELTEELLDGGYSLDTPVSAVSRATWPDQKIIRATIGTIAKKIKAEGISRQTMLIVGDVLKNAGEASKLYDAAFTHGYRKGTEEIQPLPAKEVQSIKECAVYAISEAGSLKAKELAEKLGADLFLQEKFKLCENAVYFESGALEETIRNNWKNYKSHIFIMATGIVMRKIAPLIKSKLSDPAVLVCDEKMQFVISLLSGHIGGANRLAARVSDLTGAQAVITTATDVQNVMAFDELASIRKWQIQNPEMIKTLNSALLEKKKIAVRIPEEDFKEFYAENPKIKLIRSSSDISPDTDCVVILDELVNTGDIPCLFLKSVM